ncbi:MAG: 3-hydroxyacyl-CoA dehydrogenase family protein, partial [Nitrosopumilus sp.]|nr:3-hydroxyacyl-CoA dehydrogenase family protein [Nitrosopumilus sp.]
FYKYSDDKYERVELSEELAQKYNPIQLVANILNNAAWLVSNGASDIEEIEKAAQLGLGLKKPLFETAKDIGIKNIVDELNKLALKHGEFYKPDSLLVSMQ